MLGEESATNFSQRTSDDMAPLTTNEPGSPSEPRRKLGWVRFAFFTFCFTSAGPFGIEAAVKAGGPLIALLLIALIPVLHVTPIVLSMVEMSSWMPSNHGSNLWIDRAFGHFLGFVNAVMNMFTNVVDLSIYPVMGMDYLVLAFMPDISFGARWGLTCVFVLVGSLPAFVGMEEMGTFSGILSAGILVPFVIGFFEGLPTAKPAVWGQVNSVSDMDFGELLSIGIWLYTGFVGLGSLGGEVKSHTAIIKGCYACLAVSIPAYALPLMVALQVGGDWDDGYLGTAFNVIMPGLGTAVSIAGGFSGFALYCSSLAGTGRTIWGIADIGWLPQVFRYTHPKTGAPIPAVVVQMIITMLFAAFDFKFLVQLEMVVGTAGYLLYFLAFVTLRYKEPFGHRKFTVPGGKMFAWLLVAPIFVLWCILFVTSIMADWRVDVGVIGMMLFVALIYLKFVRGKERKRFDYSHSEVTGTPVGSPQLRTTQNTVPPERDGSECTSVVMKTFSDK